MHRIFLVWDVQTIQQGITVFSKKEKFHKIVNKTICHIASDLTIFLKQINSLNKVEKCFQNVVNYICIKPSKLTLPDYIMNKIYSSINKMYLS